MRTKDKRKCDARMLVSERSLRQFRLNTEELKMNAQSARVARQVIRNFQRLVRGDAEDAVADLLLYLMHMCDRSFDYEDFDEALERAASNYDDCMRDLVFQK